VRVKNLLAQQTYTVQEVDLPENYEVVDTDLREVTMPIYSLSKSITFTNDYLLRDLSVSKMVSYDAQDTALAQQVAERQFTMTLQLQDETGSWVAQPNQPFTIQDAAGNVVTDDSRSYQTNEQGQFQIKHGETAIFEKLGAVGDAYRVTETADEEFPQLYPAQNAPQQGTLADEDNAIRFINGQPGMLLIEKEYTALDDGAQAYLDAAQNSGTENLDIQVQIMVKNATDASYQPYQGSYAELDAKGQSVSAAADIGTDGTVTLAYGHTIILSGLAETTQYQLTETLPSGNGVFYDGENWYQIGMDTVQEGTVGTNPQACFKNTLTAVSADNRITKYMAYQETVPAGSVLTWRVERYNGSSWQPAAGIAYFVILDDQTVPDRLQQTDENGLLQITKPDDAMINNYEFAVLFAEDVKVNLYSGMQQGDLRVVEVPELSDAAWGHLVAYADADGVFSKELNATQAKGFVNSTNVTTLTVEKKVIGASGSEPFTMTIYELPDGTMDSKTAAQNIPYVLYDTTTGQKLGDGVTDANGSFTLLAGQKAVLTIAEEASYWVTETAPYPYTLKEITKSEHDALSDVANGVQYSANLVASPVLKSGLQFRDYAPNAIRVSFEQTYDPNVEMGAGPWDVSEAQDGTVMAYTDKLGNELKICANVGKASKIAANENSSELFACMNWLINFDGTNLDTSNVTNMNSMFAQCSSLTNVDGLSNWNTSNVTDMGNMFSSMFNGSGRGSKLTNVDGLSKWNTSNVTDMSNMFNGCTSLTNVDGLSKWNTSNVTDMSNMFNLSGYDSKLTNVDGLSKWNTSKVTDMSNMFSGCNLLTNVDGLSKWNTSNVTDMSNMFSSCTSLTNVDGLSKWNTSKVTGMNAIFFNCSSLTDLSGLSNWNTSNVTEMSYMFAQCSSLTNVDGLSKWDTSKVEAMYSTFYTCRALTDLSGLSNWDTSELWMVEYMFQYCTSLTDVNGLSNWDTSKFRYMSHMFQYCESLMDVSGLSNWNVSNVASTYDMFYGVPASPLPSWYQE
jgi:surface protein